MNELDTQPESVSAWCVNKILPKLVLLLLLLLLYAVRLTRTNRGGRNQTVDFINIKDSFFLRKHSILF
jgi:hypothetical protein